MYNSTVRNGQPRADSHGVVANNPVPAEKRPKKVQAHPQEHFLSHAFFTQLKKLKSHLCICCICLLWCPGTCLLHKFGPSHLTTSVLTSVISYPWNPPWPLSPVFPLLIKQALGFCVDILIFTILRFGNLPFQTKYYHFISVLP